MGELSKGNGISSIRGGDFELGANGVSAIASSDVVVEEITPITLMPLEDSLDLVLGTGSVAFTRSTTGRFDDRNDGLVKTAVIDAARFEANGVLIEGASTNLLLRSEEFNNAAWTKVASSISADSTVAPDGNSTGDKLVENSATNIHNVSQATTVAAGTATLSFFAKAAERNWVRCNFAGSAGEVFFDVLNGTVGTAGSTASITQLTNGWFRCIMTSTININAVAAINLASADGVSNYAGDGTSGAFIFGADIEQLQFASSSIKTVASTVTRALDDNSVSALNIPAPADDYTFHTVVDVLGLDSGKSQILFNVDGETTRRVAINTTTGIIEATHGAVTSVSTTAITPGTPMEITFSVNGINQTLYIDKVQEDQDAKGTVTGTATRMSLGNNAGADQVFAKFKPVRIYDVALTDSQQAAL